MQKIPFDTGVIWGIKEFFRYPDKEIFIADREDLLKVLQFAEQSGLNLYEIKEVIHDKKSKLSEIQIDFTNLFVNGVPTAKSHPFAGWYSGDEIVFGDSDKTMLHFYSRYGVIYDRDNALPADHILVELEFIAIMLEEYQNKRDYFYISGLKEMIDHMNKWIPSFVSSIKNNAQTMFYKEVASILELALNMLKATLEEVKFDG